MTGVQPFCGDPTCTKPHTDEEWEARYAAPVSGEGRDTTLREQIAAAIRGGIERGPDRWSQVAAATDAVLPVVDAHTADLQAEVGRRKSERDDAVRALSKAQARIDKVRALCDESDDLAAGLSYIASDEIRAALAPGDTEEGT